MSLNSVNTNLNAYIALQSLNQTSAGLSAAQKQVSTGFRVADASDDGAAFAVAQKVRSDVSGLTAVTQQLGTAKGLVGVAQTALTSVSTAFGQIKALLVSIADATASSDQRSQYVTQYQKLVSTISNAVDGSVYNNQTLLGSTYTGGPAGSSFNVVTDETGTASTLDAQDQSGTGSNLAQTLNSFIGGSAFVRTKTLGVNVDTFGTATDFASTSTSVILLAAQTALSSTSSSNSLSVLQNTINTSLNAIGSANNFIDATITFTNNKIDSLNAGLGALIDADLTKESAVLQSLQIKQQLGTQALSIANQSPQSLLSLFK